MHTGRSALAAYMDSKVRHNYLRVDECSLIHTIPRGNNVDVACMLGCKSRQPYIIRRIVAGEIGSKSTVSADACPDLELLVVALISFGRGVVL